MNENLKYGLLFALGLTAGALGAVALSRGKLNLKPAMADLVAAGMEIKEKAAAVIERCREEVEDVVAEADHVRKNKGKVPAGGDA